MFLTALLSYFYEDGITNSLLSSGIIVSVVGLIMLFLNKNHDKQINKREGYLVVVLGWLAMIFSPNLYQNFVYPQLQPCLNPVVHQQQFH